MQSTTRGCHPRTLTQSGTRHARTHAVVQVILEKACRGRHEEELERVQMNEEGKENERKWEEGEGGGV